jgi:hypothetical protein
MRLRASRALRWALGAAVGIACLCVGENGSLTIGSSLIPQANARDARPLKPLRIARAARRSIPRAIVGGGISGTFYFGNSGGSGGASYGYAPGTYGGVGCYRNVSGVLVCP